MKQILLPIRKIRILPLSQSDGEDHLLTEPHQFSDTIVLNGGKSGETVEHYHTVSQKLRLLQRPGQHVQRLLRRDIVIADVIPKPKVKPLQIGKLPRKGLTARGVIDQFRHILRTDPILHKLRDGTLHLMDIALPV